MISKLKCCFCGAELDDAVEHLVCPNTNCKFGCNPMTTFVWQALIDGKKAQDALKKITDYVPLVPAALDLQGRAFSNHFAQIKKIATETLNEITSITKQEE